MAIGDVPLTPIIDPVTGAVTEIGRIFLRTLTTAVGALAPIDAAYWVSQGAAVLTADVNLGALASGYLKIATGAGVAMPATVAAIPAGDVAGLAAALALKAPLLSPALAGTPTTPTAAPGTNTTQIASTAFVLGAVPAPNPAGTLRATVTNSAAQSLTSGAVTALTFATAPINVGPLWAAGAPTRLTIPAGAGGTYAVHLTAGFSPVNAGQRIAFVRVNGATPVAPNVYAIGTIFPVSVIVARHLVLAAGDFLEACVYQDTGSPLNTGDPAFGVNVLECVRIA